MHDLEGCSIRVKNFILFHKFLGLREQMEGREPSYNVFGLGLSMRYMAGCSPGQ